MIFSKIILGLLSKVYAAIVGIRAWLYRVGVLKSYRSNLPIICVGNVSVGGNGKTPLVIYLVNLLKENGKSPVILTRGYGGKLKGPVEIDTMHAVEDVGDEAILCKFRTGVPVIVSANRAAGAKYIEENNLGDLIIMDDGYQHFGLQRDFNILCFDVSSDDAVKTVTDDTLLPLGRLRESLSSGLERADCVVFNSRSTEVNNYEAPLIQLIPAEIKTYKTKLDLIQAGSLNEEKVLDNSESVVLLSGIARPEAFLETVQAAGYIIKDTVFYPDHYFYTQSDLDSLNQKFPNANFICTEKDAVKLKDLNLEQISIYVLDVSIEFVGDQIDLSRLT